MRAPFALLPLIVLSLGCGRETPAGGGVNEPSHVETPETPEGRGPANELRVAADMLRDVRMTITPVETRAAAESSSTLVGELRVNEERYGEVSAPVSGRISRVLADVGQQVRAGQTLAELQSPDVGRARAALLSAGARLELARRGLERKRILADERIAPLREVQEAEADANAAEAELRAARAELSAIGVSSDSAEADGADASRLLLRAPVAGVVIERDVVIGQSTAAEKTLFRIGDLSRLWLIVHAFERDAVRVSSGARATIVFSALPGESFAGTVTVVGRQVDLGSRTMPIRIEVENAGGQLRPGMSAAVMLPLGSGSATILTVPVAALQRFADEWVVFVPKAEGHFDIRAVGRGRDFGTEVEIVRGLSPQERVVVEGAFVLKAEAEKARGQSDGHAH